MSFLSAHHIEDCLPEPVVDMPNCTIAETRVLIIEGQQDSEQFVESVLKQNFFNVAGHAGTGSDAVREALALRPDLILMDVMLPGEMNGIEAAREIQNVAKIPVIFMSNCNDRAMLTTIRGVHPFGYIRKPFTAAEMLIGIEMAMLRFELENELRENEKMLQMLFEQESDAIIIVDIALRTIADSNEAVLRIYGYTREELKDQDLLMLMDDSNYNSLCRAYEAEHTGQPFLLVRLEHRKKDGTLFPVACRGRVIEINGREHLFCSLRDSTEKIRREEAEALLQAQVLHSEKMACIGVLAAGIAHEINNPMAFVSSNLYTLDKYLNKIGGFLGFLSQQIETCGMTDLKEVVMLERQESNIDYVLKDAADIVSESTNGAERIKKIVQDLRVFTRSDAAEPELFDVHECMENTISIIWNELKYKAQLDKQYGDIPRVLGYQQKFSQVLMNLLVNAGHAIETEGAITIKTWCEDADVFVSIADTGCGIREENLKKIFEPFFTTKEAGKGSGLGLSIVYDIVTKKLNGDISVETRLGEGSTFTVRLPIEYKIAD